MNARKDFRRNVLVRERLLAMFPIPPMWSSHLLVPLDMRWMSLVRDEWDVKVREFLRSREQMASVGQRDAMNSWAFPLQPVYEWWEKQTWGKD